MNERYQIWTLSPAMSVVVVIAYLVVYVLLDQLSYVFPWQSFGITPWNPPPGLSLALLLLGGLRFAPALFPAALIAELTVQDSVTPPGLKLATSLILAGGYSLAAWVLARRMSMNPLLRRHGDLSRFVAVVLVAVMGVGLGFVGVHVAAGYIASADFVRALMNFWVGDVIGILALTPLLLVLGDSDRRARLLDALRRRETLVQLVAVFVTMVLVFGVSGIDEFKAFYLLFLPLVWIAVRHGLAGATVAVLMVQIGMFIALRAETPPAATVLELQTLMLAYAVTGLFLGVTVDERERAQESLRQSLRLAAASEMAGTLAHELSQPLAAMGNYAQAARLMLELAPPDLGRLGDTLTRLSGEVGRAAEVMRRMRDFLGSGVTQLGSVAAESLVNEAIAAMRNRADAADIQLLASVAGPLPLLRVDRIEVGVVLRNLLANACDAVTASRRPRRRIEVVVRPESDDWLRLSVIDTGPGVAPALRDRLFRAFVSSKPSGMGLGLSISRAIVEAHGGRLWYESGEGAGFHMTLPIVKKEQDAH